MAIERIEFACAPQTGMLCAVRRLWLFIKYWLPPLLWMSAIFFVSADSASVSRSSQLIGPLVRWLLPDISDAALGGVVLAIRKLAHVTEYAFCAILLWRALRQHTSRDTRPWTRREAWLAWALAAAYAVTDEIHQCFVPGRQGAVADVLLDSIGAALGLLALWAAGRWSKRW
jgi:VanZ family protein